MKLIETVRVDRVPALSTNIHVIFVYFNTNMYGAYYLFESILLRQLQLSTRILYILPSMNHWFYDGAVFFQCVG